MARVSDNDNLELKKRSRRRLVGAATLALIAAIILPMVMDGEPVKPSQEIQVTIPDGGLVGGPVAAYPEPIPAVPFDDGAPEAESVPEVEQAVRPVVPEPLAESPPPQAAVAPAPAPPAPASTPPAAPPAPKAPPAASPPADAPAPPSVPAPSAATDEGERARAILEGRDRQAAAASAGREFVVQVGAFSDPEKASSRQLELAARGFKSFIEVADGVSRVRIGPFASRSDAEAMLERLKRASLEGVVSTR
jgi:DedD protein